MTLRTGEFWVRRAMERVPCIDAAEARRRREADPRVVVLDVREPDEVAASPVPGALHLPRGLLEMRIASLVPEEDRPILVCCATGGRAALAACTLQEMGYRDVAAIACPHEELVRTLSS